MTLEQLSKKYFGLPLPCDKAALKHAFRAAAKRLHTDTSGADTKAAFIEMKEAYDLLLMCPGALAGGEKDFCCTEEGTPLSDLGLGLGHKNGKPCEKCKGQGYYKTWDWVLKPTRPGAVPCPTCARMQSSLGCSRCWGKFKRVQETIYKICAACQGHGEIELFNPVIPKGLLVCISSKKHS